MVGRDSPEVRFDGSRENRIGLVEAILADVKSPRQISEALEQAEQLTGRALVTRMSREQFGALSAKYRDRIDYDPISRTGFLGVVPDPLAELRVAILTGGTGDVPVAREATRTLTFHGVGTIELNDVGVAGLWRLMEHRATIEHMSVLIVCAGMEGALFSVVGGLTSGVVLAVPVSSGYGVASGGRVALNSALASCAPGIVVVNIDNGYGAACAAIRILAACDGLVTARSVTSGPQLTL
ncbi:MAG: circadian phase modifier CpmA [Rhodospirillaceae bacterium]|nr:circadian phase modifier CpmA [Rhodospirillaceae bacterium]